jgi:hypothetical protein
MNLGVKSYFFILIHLNVEEDKIIFEFR